MYLDEVHTAEDWLVEYLQSHRAPCSPSLLVELVKKQKHGNGLIVKEALWRLISRGKIAITNTGDATLAENGVAAA